MLINEKGGSLTMSGRLCGAPLADLPEEERQRVYYYSVFPSFFLTVQPDFVMVTRLVAARGGPDARSSASGSSLPRRPRAPGFDPSDGVEIWDITNRQDWHMCELAQQGVSSRAYRPGPYSKDESLLAAFDREYLRSLVGILGRSPCGAP